MSKYINPATLPTATEKTLASKEEHTKPVDNAVTQRSRPAAFPKKTTVAAAQPKAKPKAKAKVKSKPKTAPKPVQPEFTEIEITDVAGRKFDKEKARTDLLSPFAVTALSDVLTFGAGKYGDRNWEKGMLWSRVYGACLRHLFAFWQGENTDPESGLPHLDHAAACIHFLQHYYHAGDAKNDNRPYSHLVR